MPMTANIKIVIAVALLQLSLDKKFLTNLFRVRHISDSSVLSLQDLTLLSRRRRFSEKSDVSLLTVSLLLSRSIEELDESVDGVGVTGPGPNDRTLDGDDVPSLLGELGMEIISSLEPI